jgi:ribosomal protein L11 methyltransferase
VAPGGALVLAGILERQQEQMRAAYAPWCELVRADQEDGWVLMVGQQPSTR